MLLWLNYIFAYSSYNFKEISDPIGSKRQAERLRDIFLDRLMPSLDEGVFSIDRLLRRPAGRRNSFQPRGMHNSWARFFYAEFAVLIFALLVIVAL